MLSTRVYPNLFLSPIGSIFGTKKEKKPKKPNTIQVPPPEDENAENSESKDVEDSPSADQNELKGLDSEQFFANMKVNKKEENPNEYNPPDLFAGLNMSMSSGLSFGSQPTQNLGMNMGQPPTQNSGFPMQLNLGGGMNTQNRPAGFSPGIGQMPTQNQQEVPSMFSGISLTNQSYNPNQYSAPTQFPNVNQQNTSSEFVNLGKDGEPASTEGVKLDQTGTTDISFPKEEQLSKDYGQRVEPSSDYAPPDLFGGLNISTHNIQTRIDDNPPAPTQPQSSGASHSAGYWSSYKKGQNAKTPVNEPKPVIPKITEKARSFKPKPSTPDSETKKNEANFSCSSIHNVSKHSLIDEDKDISLLKDKNNEDSDDSVLIDQKYPIDVDSDSDKKSPVKYTQKYEVRVYLNSEITRGIIEFL